MILLVVIILSTVIACWSMNIGLYAMLSRYVMVVLAVAAGIGFSGPLRQSIPTDNRFLYGPCLLTVAVLMYALQRKLAQGCLDEPELALPPFINRLGGGLLGFLLTMTCLSYLALVLATFPLPEQDVILPEIRQIARLAVGTARAVSLLAGTGRQITLDTVLPQ
ncbi:MAG TPA: hypothetical protein PLL20_19095 [Phycisphaerae bacterium]|nr:hypothetical protein [Phycisphaerae bacterium]HRR86221.1 hypothetical protein [Phycisphaerae bacterium]